MTFEDGQRVSYIGQADVIGMQPGDEGMVLSDGGSGAHVMWSTGSALGKVTLTDDYKLALVGYPVTATYDDGLDASLDVGPRPSTGVPARGAPGAHAGARAGSRDRRDAQARDRALEGRQISPSE